MLSQFPLVGHQTKITSEGRSAADCALQVGLSSGQTRHVAEAVGIGNRPQRIRKPAAGWRLRGVLQIDDGPWEGCRLQSLGLSTARPQNIVRKICKVRLGVIKHPVKAAIVLLGSGGFNRSLQQLRVS